jgi:hypothetical protein
MYDTFAQQTQLNITSGTVVKGGSGVISPGRLAKISVIVAGSAAGAAYDTNTTGSVATANEIAIIPNTVGIYQLDWPFFTGLVIVPGTGQTVAVSYS